MTKFYTSKADINNEKKKLKNLIKMYNEEKDEGIRTNIKKKMDDCYNFLSTVEPFEKLKI